MSTHQPQKPQTADPPVELTAALLQTASYRRYVTDPMMWQVPVLSLTAQSFLLTIAFGADGRAGRALAAGLAAVAALAAVQLLLKHRYNEETASRALERLERDHNLTILDGRPEDVQRWAWPNGVHGWEDVSGQSIGLRLARRARRRLARPRSYLVWTYTLLLFSRVGVGLGEVAGGDGDDVPDHSRVDVAEERVRARRLEHARVRAVLRDHPHVESLVVGREHVVGNGSSFEKTALPPSATTETNGMKFICAFEMFTVCRRAGTSSLGPSSR